VSNKRRYKGVAIIESVEIAKETTTPKRDKLPKRRLKPSEMDRPFVTATPGPYLGPINSVMLTAWNEALARKQEQTR
jgi:hypothetical protein